MDYSPASQPTAACIYQAAKEYTLPVEIIVAVLVAEGGKVGAVSKNTNGTYDIGPMQVNSIHTSSDPAGSLKKNALLYDGCYNVAYGAYRLRVEIDRVSDFWTGVGNYHSRTPRLRERYLTQRIIPAISATTAYSAALRSAFASSDRKTEK